jgi:hypothetical protein
MRHKSAVLSALLLGAALFTGGAASADPKPHPAHPAPRAWHGGGWHGGAWHGGPRPAVRNRFVFHNDFRHFTPVERRWWNGGRWSHRWWHGRYGWWWGVGGNFYFYNAPVYPYPDYVSPTYYGDDYSDDGDDQGYGGDQGYGPDQGPGPNQGYGQGGDYPPGGPGDMQGGPGAYQGGPDEGAGVWYHCSSPEGYYPYIKSCKRGWEQVPATPNDMQGGPPPGGPGGQGDYGPSGGQYPDDQNGPPPPGR